MIPTPDEAKALWKKYAMPEEKAKHLTLVAKTAVFFARGFEKKGVVVNIQLLEAAALLHDIDKGVEKKKGERHPDAAVRVIRSEHMEELVPLIASHPLHMILNKEKGPKTLEEKLLFLADKMVKYEILTVDKRFDLWRAEDLPKQGRVELERAYPKVKELEEKILGILGLEPQDVAKIAY
jgi:predicted hydrolase (HD superfamily)